MAGTLRGRGDNTLEIPFENEEMALLRGEPTTQGFQNPINFLGLQASIGTVRQQGFRIHLPNLPRGEKFLLAGR